MIFLKYKNLLMLLFFLVITSGFNSCSVYKTHYESGQLKTKTIIKEGKMKRKTFYESGNLLSIKKNKTLQRGKTIKEKVYKTVLKLYYEQGFKKKKAKIETSYNYNGFTYELKFREYCSKRNLITEFNYINEGAPVIMSLKKRKKEVVGFDPDSVMMNIKLFLDEYDKLFIFQ